MKISGMTPESCNWDFADSSVLCLFHLKIWLPVHTLMAACFCPTSHVPLALLNTQGLWVSIELRLSNTRFSSSHSCYFRSHLLGHHLICKMAKIMTGAPYKKCRRSWRQHGFHEEHGMLKPDLFLSLQMQSLLITLQTQCKIHLFFRLLGKLQTEGCMRLSWEVCLLHLLLLIAITKSSPHCTSLCRSAIRSYVLIVLQHLEKCRVIEVNK